MQKEVKELDENETRLRDFYEKIINEVNQVVEKSIVDQQRYNDEIAYFGEQISTTDVASLFNSWNKFVQAFKVC